MSIPIGSTVAVQWEDRGPWTHGTVIGKGDPNHYNRSCKIQVTKRGRIITHNRQCIKLAPITTENFLHNHANKHTKNRPSRQHPWSYSKTSTATYKQNYNIWRSNNNNMAYEHKKTNGIQDIKGKQREEEFINTIWDNEHKNNGENIVRTRYGRIVRRPDRLMYKQ